MVWLMSFGEKTSITEHAVTGTLTNYLRSFDAVYLQIIWKSIWISLLATAFCLLAAYPIAFGICFAPERWKPLLLLARDPAVLDQSAHPHLCADRGAAQRGLRQSRARLAVERVGARPATGAKFQPLEMLYNNGAVIAGLVYVYMPFMVLPLYATIERLDRSYLEASLDLGASQFRTFFRVTVPLTMPGIVSGVILVFIPCLGAFLTPDLLGGTNAAMIGNVIERQFKAANDWPFGAALSFLADVRDLRGPGPAGAVRRVEQGCGRLK